MGNFYSGQLFMALAFRNFEKDFNELNIILVQDLRPLKLK